MRYHYTPIRMAKLQTTPNAGEKVEQRELSFIAFESSNGRVTLEDSLGVSYKTKHTLKIHTIQSRNCAFIIQMRGKFMPTQKPEHRCIQQLYSQLPKNLEATEMSFSRLMDK